MKTFILGALLALSTLGHAQNVTIKPLTSDETLQLQTYNTQIDALDKQIMALYHAQDAFQEKLNKKYISNYTWYTHSYLEYSKDYKYVIVDSYTYPDPVGQCVPYGTSLCCTGCTTSSNTALFGNGVNRYVLNSNGSYNVYYYDGSYELNVGIPDQTITGTTTVPLFNSVN